MTPAASYGASPSCSPRDRTRARRLRRGDRRAGPAGLRPRSTVPRRDCAPSSSSGKRLGQGRHVARSTTTSASLPGFPATSSPPGVAAGRRLGAEILVTRRSSGSTRIRARFTSTGVTVLALEHHLACGVPGDGCHWTASTVSQQGVSYGASRIEAASTHGEDIHIVGAGNSAARAGLVLLHSRADRDVLCRGDALAKACPAISSTDSRRARNIEVRFGAEVAGSMAKACLEAIDVRDSETGTVTRLSSGGLFISAVPTRKPAWLPDDIALAREVSSSPARTSGRRDAGHWIATPTSSKPACRESLPAATSGLRR